MNNVQINSLAVKTVIGVYAWERRIQQTLLIDIAFPVTSANDALATTIDYAALSQACIDFAAQADYQLLETFIQALCTHLTTHFALQQISLTVHKPHAVPSAKDVSVSLEWNKT